MDDHLPLSSLVTMRALLVGAVMALVSLPVCNAITDSLIVRVRGGLVRGMVHRGAVRFMGIPYGTAQRFQYPSMSVASWTGIRNASHPGPQCPQKCSPFIRDLYCLPDNQESESCLTLNVYRPATVPRHPYPVMVYIHGGGFQTGSGAAPLYDGDFLAGMGGVIVVTLNYRLGAFGFLPIFNSYDDVIGNFGLRDQQMALRWVKENIANFNGDPNKVTLFGSEAGCQSVGFHLTSLTSSPLFHSAIMHSCPFTIPFRSKNESRQIAKDFANALGCAENDVSCLRKKSTQDVKGAENTVTNATNLKSSSLRKFQIWGPTVDKSNIFDSNLMEEILSSNIIQNKPIMIGYVAQESMNSVFHKYPLPMSDKYFERLIKMTLPEKWPQVASSAESPYHASNPDDARLQLVNFLNDFVYICPARRVAAKLTKAATSQPKTNFWMYKFDPKITWSPDVWTSSGGGQCQGVACQNLDLFHLFNPAAIPNTIRGPSVGLRRAMVFYWTNFAKYHNPNGNQNMAEPFRAAHVVQQSFLLNRGVNFATHSEPVFVGFPLRNNNLATSLNRLLQGARFASGSSRTGSSLLTARSLQSLVNRRLQQRQTSNVVSSLRSLLPPLRQSSMPRSSSQFPAWPAHVILNPVTSLYVNATLVLTQPSPRASTVYDQACQFWDNIGFH